MAGRTGEIAFKEARNPIHHVIYIIKENRTYDQLFGDIGEANGDPSLAMYGEDITPNQHKLARQFGLLDNFYDSGEVSGDGHVWSTAAITSDYTERTWPITLSWQRARATTSKALSADQYPMKQGISDVNEPGTGYLWSNLARNHSRIAIMASSSATWWCEDWRSLILRRRQGHPGARHPECAAQGSEAWRDSASERLAEARALTSSRYPMMAYDVATKPELRDHFDPQLSPTSKSTFPISFASTNFCASSTASSTREEERQGDSAAAVRHPALAERPHRGHRPNSPTPNASVADNDLAVGRVVEAISHSPYWDDTAIFVLEDDAQNGADHVDAHRSMALVISKYSPRRRSSPSSITTSTPR